MRDEYISAIEAVGFHKVSIIDETPFPIDCIANDPTTKALIETLNIPLEEVREAATSVISIKVDGVKPN